jgi:ABC-type transport system involved in cytochrome c biogenesis ATPase subunit
VPIRRLVRPWWWVDAEPVSAIVLANVAEFAHAIHVHNQVGTVVVSAAV